GNDVTIYEAIHGTAPDIAGRGVANPTALALSACMMLRDIGYREQGDRLEHAIRSVIKERRTVTPDLGGTSSTQDFTKAVIAQLS
ncbi:MAG: isocitrate/isopropylmalate family dehydrogenase, partial [Myxococcota bacterium]